MGQGLDQGFEAEIQPDLLVQSLIMSVLPSVALGFVCSCVKYSFCSGPNPTLPQIGFADGVPNEVGAGMV